MLRKTKDTARDTIGRRKLLRKRLAFPIGAVLLGLCIGLAVAEIALRIRHGKIEHITGVAEWSPDNTGGDEEFRFNGARYDPLLGWTSLPGYRGDGKYPFRLTINNQGLRGQQDYSPSPAEGITRIAMFGDSCVWGAEVDDDQTVPAYLERWLKKTEVLNFGEASYGLGQMMLRLEKEGFQFHPQQVVFVVMLPSDLARDRVSLYDHAKPVFDVQASDLVIRNVPVPVATGQQWLFRHSFLAARLLGRPPQTLDKPARLDETLEVSRLILRRVKADCDKQGVPLTVVTIGVAPLLAEARTNPALAEMVVQMRQRLAAQNLDLLDLIPVMDQDFLQHADWIAPDGHWRGAANCRIAQLIAQHLAIHQRDLTISEMAPLSRPEDTPGNASERSSRP